MHRRMWHRDDACILLVSGKPFVEEIDSVSSSVLFPRYRSRWRGTFSDALIISPTLLLDVEACHLLLLPVLAHRSRDCVMYVLAPRKPGRITTRSIVRTTQSVEQRLQRQSGTRLRYRCRGVQGLALTEHCAGDDNALETDGSRGAQLGSPPADWAMTMPWSAPLC